MEEEKKDKPIIDHGPLANNTFCGPPKTLAKTEYEIFKKKEKENESKN
jgi:hypothetical protein